MKQRQSSSGPSINKAKRQAIHHEKRKSMKFQQREINKKVKANKKSKDTSREHATDSEEEEGTGRIFNHHDEDEFVVASGSDNDIESEEMEVSHPIVNKKKKRQEVPIVESEEENQEKKSSSEDNENESDEDSDIYDPALQKQQQREQSKHHPPLLIILDLASLETVKTKKGDFQLLNCDDHISLIRKFHKDPSEFRPDIIHQELMTVLDSPLNKAGKIKVLVHTEKNVLFEVNNKTRIPRTFKRFSGLMVQLLHRLKIRSADGREMLLKVIKNPISRYIPAGARCVGFSDQGKFQTPTQFAKSIPQIKDESKYTPLVLVFGAQATKGILQENHPYIEEMVSISNHGLSGVVAINRVLGAIESHWNIS